MALIGSLSCAELTQRMLAFARRQPLQPRPLDLGNVCRNITKLLGRTLGESVHMDVSVAADLWLVMADPAQVESSLINLAVNARDAMTEGGVLRVEAGNVHFAHRDDEIPAGDFVVLSVTDNGAGMTRDVLTRAVEPFFTTKKMGHGTGLGLSMVYGFMRQSGGHMRIDSAPGRGTSVRLYLPRVIADARTEIATVDEASDEYSGFERTVLLVEDDAGVRAVTASLLRERQFAVIEADNGARALEIIDREPVIDLLFTDVVMPGGMDGFQLGKLARERRANLPVLYATGYAASFSASEQHADVLAKPYREKDLLAKLRTLLPQPAQA
jgi:CheY-like chemotaxis protein